MSGRLRRGKHLLYFTKLVGSKTFLRRVSVQRRHTPFSSLQCVKYCTVCFQFFQCHFLLTGSVKEQRTDEVEVLRPEISAVQSQVCILKIFGRIKSLEAIYSSVYMVHCSVCRVPVGVSSKTLSIVVNTYYMSKFDSLKISLSVNYMHMYASIVWQASLCTCINCRNHNVTLFYYFIFQEQHYVKVGSHWVKTAS